ncbi:AMP-binding protein [Aeromicrobium sp. UC242_57]|uniref:AMP-binding protein n=1 Tax=Aeromicrobium sp. UC242_57 TaxID=3374624 RepID=UPI00378F7EAB
MWQAGGTLVPYNYLFHPSALRHTTEDAGVQWIITTAADVPRLKEALAGLPAADRLVSLEPADGTAATWAEVMQCVSDDDTTPRLDTDDAILMYTSGSTGHPKGVRQTHRNSTAVAEAAIDIWSLTDLDHALVCTPLFHVGGLQLISLPTLLAGGQVTLRRWSVREYLDDAVRLRPTFTALVPAMMIDIINELDGTPRPLDSIRICAIGGSALRSIDWMR